MAVLLKKTKLSKNGGFTLVEILVVIFIFGIVIGAAMTLFNLNVFGANTVKNNYIASGLIQEGIEVMKNLRDSDWHSGKSFGSFGSSVGVTADGSYIGQWNSAQLANFVDAFLKENTATGLFSYDEGVDTIFKRKIELSTVSAVEKKVVVTITWNQRNLARSLSAESHLFNWK